jgi:hypothetical protein
MWGKLTLGCKVLEKASSGIPVAGSPLASVFGIVSIVAEKAETLEMVPEAIRKLALEIQALLENVHDFLDRHGEHFSMSEGFQSAIFEIHL